MKRAVALFVLATIFSFGMSVDEVNSASKTDLIKIKGIGEKKADAIIQYREKSPFASLGDLKKVKGVGSALVENIKNDVHKKDAKVKSTSKE